MYCMTVGVVERDTWSSSLEAHYLTICETSTQSALRLCVVVF